MVTICYYIIIIWLMMVNNLVAGKTTPLKNMKNPWEGWHPIYEMENNPAMFQTTQPDCKSLPWNTSRNSTPSRAVPRGRTLTGVSNRSPARLASTWWGTESWRCTRWSSFLRPDAKWVRVRFKPTKRSLVGGFNPSEKYESQMFTLFPIYGKIKNVPNHQPDIDGSRTKKNDSHFVGPWKHLEDLTNTEYPNSLMFLPMGHDILIRSLRAHQKELPFVVKF